MTSIREPFLVQVRGGGAFKREAALRAAAALHLQAGNVTAYCTAMASAGDWDAACTAAPAVSFEFWRQMLRRRCAAALQEGAPGAMHVQQAVHATCRLLRFLQSRKASAAACASSSAKCVASYDVRHC